MFKLRRTWIWVLSLFGLYGLSHVLDDDDMTCDPGLDPLDHDHDFDDFDDYLDHDLCMEDEYEP